MPVSELPVEVKADNSSQIHTWAGRTEGGKSMKNLVSARGSRSQLGSAFHKHFVYHDLKESFKNSISREAVKAQSILYSSHVS